jgi:hypothetical protein
MLNPFKSQLFEEATGEPTGGTPPVVTPPDQPDYAAQVAKLTKERDEATARAKESDDAAKYWHGKVRGSAEEKKSAPEKEDTTDLLDLVAKGPKAMNAWLKSQNLMTREEVQAEVNARAHQIVTEQRLADRYPELKDNSSAFHKATIAAAVELKRQGVPDLVALELAAERVANASPKPDAKGDDGDDDVQRKQRAKAQGPEGTKRTRQAPTEASDDLSQIQLAICDGMGIDPEKYKARAKAGVMYAKAVA